MNFPSKSREDFHKIHFNIELILTEQRAQRVDLARVIQLVRQVMNDKSTLKEYDESIPVGETEID